MTEAPAFPSPEELREAILATRATYLAEGHSLWDIGNGLCEEFADAVLTRVFGKNWVQLEAAMVTEGAAEWHTADSTTLFLPIGDKDTTEGAESWDWALLERLYGLQIPEDQRSAHDAIVDDFMAHVWIWFRGRHYDCEHPEGVENFFDLNFFRRHLGRPEIAEAL